ncbi:microtubule-binding protein [Bdellovibrio sp. SKB1291214]|uniref:microtubule-binding protein n=1 Tax=Bdellovibrio sp. SKB1291214 TaxID=1732569 RepID=UPI000B51DC6F|nr:microtubule-binding protein [Bdellovibrio sp. SKB1291214]UYL09663.1 microtubule-binding protein [Bdellovibrio sp. SKB1291214]
MSFNYEKHKGHDGGGDSFWTSYSDLFLGLSTIFLLLYVVASLRTGTDALRGQIENQKLSMQVEELQHQLNMYESVKNDYIANQAPKDEAQEYQELMDKLTLLQEDAKSEKDKLVQQALENDKKAKALNKYQQMVRNVMNANKMAKAKIINRDDLIKDQDVTIDDQENQITDLNKDIAQKKQLIAQGEQQIAAAEDKLQKRQAELKWAYKANKMNKAKYEKQMAAAQAEANSKISHLSNVNAQYTAQLQQANAQLGQTQSDLNKTKGLLAQKEGEARGLQGQLGEVKGQLGAVNSELMNTKGALAATSGQLEATKGELGQTKGQLGQLQGQVGNLKGELGNLKGKLGETEGQLAAARAEIEARKSVANEISKGFAKAGIKAEIDGQTGDVVLDFGQQYFDNDSDKLKREMKGVIEKAMPIYSRSLFGNPKISDKVSAVEIVGFASPTYQGRFIDPKSNKPGDKEALKYNMDLSYRRAKSIFNYMLDEDNVRFEHQKQLMGLMKVSGRSFLEVMKVQNRGVATAAEFCKQNDCKKAQRVIIRFSMDQKK